ncbi:MAG: glycosyltransferase family 39 protein [Candidatus Shapirobacteria bacterium]|nr:glycosyltransferase family 39 protein [Candidatus Shapirobacteria bacterium]
MINYFKRNIYLGGYIFIFILAIFFRLFRLSSIPYGFHVDEAKAAWNAYSILKTGADDKGNFFPMYYDSFGDFRPTGLMYLIIPSLLLFGQNIFAVRFPFALTGALTFIPLLFIIKELFSKNYKKIGLATALILTLNPWHIIASRSTSESIVSMFFTLWGLYFLIKSLKKPNLRNLLLSTFFFITSYFFYHSIRVLAPVFVFTIIIFDWINKKRNEINFKPLIILLALMISSFVFLSSKSARGRMSQVNLLSDFGALYEITKMPSEIGPGHVFTARVFHNKVAAYSRRFVEEYVSYFSTGFLIGNLAKPIRYNVPQVGLVTYFEFLLIIIGLFYVSRSKELLLIVFLLTLAPLTGAVTIEDTPNLQRSIFMIPFLTIIAAYGLYKLFGLSKKFNIIKTLVFFGFIFNFVYFLHMYFVHQKMSIATYYRDGGNVELAKKISEIGSSYSQIILTNSPDNLYPWIAFLNKYDPRVFNKSYNEISDGVRRYNNLIFSENKCPLNSALENDSIKLVNTLYVDAEGCIIDKKYEIEYDVNLVDTILRPDFSPPYYLRSVKQLK